MNPRRMAYETTLNTDSPRNDLVICITQFIVHVLYTRSIGSRGWIRTNISLINSQLLCLVSHSEIILVRLVGLEPTANSF